MDTNKLTTAFGFIFASDQVKSAIEGVQTNGIDFYSIWHLAGAVAVAAWAYYTNKS